SNVSARGLPGPAQPDDRGVVGLGAEPQLLNQPVEEILEFSVLRGGRVTESRQPLIKMLPSALDEPVGEREERRSRWDGRRSCRVGHVTLDADRDADISVE